MSNQVPPQGPDGDEIRALVRQLDETQRRLQELTAGSAGSVDQQFASAFELAAIGVALVAPNGRILKVNRALCQMLGYTEDELLQRTLEDVTHPDDLAGGLEERGRLLAGECEAYQLEQRYLHRRGHQVWGLLSVSLVRDDAGAPVHFISQVQDLTEQRRAREALRLQALMLDEIGQAVIATDPDGYVIYANRFAGELYGWSPDSVLGEPVTELTVPQVSKDQAREIMSRLQQGMSWSGEFLVQARGGRTFPAFVTNSPLLDEHGRLIGIIGVSTDITARKLFEQTLRDGVEQQRALAGQLDTERARLLTAQSVAKVGSWETDLATMNVIWSDETHRIFETSPETFQPTHERFLQLVHPDDRERVSSAFLESLGKSGGATIEHRLLLSDGRVKFIEERWQIFRDDDGRPLRAVGTAGDITDRKLAGQELARTHRALRMLSNCNEALIRAEHEQDLLDEICRIALQDGGYRMVWVGYAQDDETKRIEPRAYAGVEDGYLSEMRFSWSETRAEGRGPAGQTVRSGRMTVVEDVEEDPAFLYWRDHARQRDYRSVICLPLREDRRTFGMLALYSDHLLQVGDDETRLLQKLADNLAFGIVNLRSRLEGQRIKTAVLRLAEGVSEASGMEFFAHLAANMAQSLDAQAAFVARLLPGEPQTVRTIGGFIEGAAFENFDSLLAASPWACLAEEEECSVPSGLGAWGGSVPALAGLKVESFAGRRLADSSGQMLGILLVLYRAPLQSSSFLSSTIKIFATRAAAEMQRQEADAHIHEQASMLDEATDAIFVRDLDDRCTYWNKSAEKLYGWSAAEAVGRPVVELFSQRDEAIVHAAMDAVLSRGAWSGELQTRSRQGDSLTIESRWTLLHDDLGKPKAILSVNTDVTERRKLEDQFLRAQRMESLGTLAGGIAHDLNNLLAPVVMGVSVLKRFEERENMLAVIRNIERSAKRGTDLVKQVLSFGRGVEGARVSVSLEDVIREVESIIASTFPKDISVQSEIAKDLRLIVGDPTQLNQVLLNLCLNARDAMAGEGGRLLLSARNAEIDEQYAIMNRGVSAGRYVVLEVTDEGCGMPREIMDRVFDPFFTTKEIGKGTGLGLSTVVGIIRSHGGFVNVHSEVGTGSTFSVYLPAAPVGTTGPEVAPLETEALARGQGELLLIVDDEVSILDITRQTLETFGYRTMVAGDGAEAIGLYAIHRHEIALVITDMMMPVMDGPALIAALFRINPEVKIIAASGLGGGESVAKASQTGVAHFLAKPYSAEAMLVLIQKALGKNSAPSESPS